MAYVLYIVNLWFYCGTPGWDRTSGFQLRRLTLYPLSYGRKHKNGGQRSENRTNDLCHFMLTSYSGCLALSLLILVFCRAIMLHKRFSPEAAPSQAENSFKCFKSLLMEKEWSVLRRPAMPPNWIYAIRRSGFFRKPLLPHRPHIRNRRCRLPHGGGLFQPHF